MFVISGLLFISNYVSGQYSVTTFTDTYSNLDNEQDLGIDIYWDDPFFVLPLGFDFSLSGVTINSFDQNTESSIAINTGDFNFTTIRYSANLIDGSLVPDGTPSFITYQVDGEEGDRICKIQYANAAFYNEFAQNFSALNRVNFQIWFYEDDFAFEFRFGPNNIPDPNVVYNDGAPGPWIGIFESYGNVIPELLSATYLSGNPSDPITESYTNSEPIFTTSLEGSPEDGRVYRFAPMQLSINDLEDLPFSIYPTLALDQIRISGEIPAGSTYKIVNITGQEVITGIYNEKEIIDIESLQPGLYILNINGYKTATKFVKQ